MVVKVLRGLHTLTYRVIPPSFTLRAGMEEMYDHPAMKNVTPSAG